MYEIKLHKFHDKSVCEVEKTLTNNMVFKLHA